MGWVSIPVLKISNHRLSGSVIHRWVGLFGAGGNILDIIPSCQSMNQLIRKRVYNVILQRNIRKLKNISNHGLIIIRFCVNLMLPARIK